MGAQGSDAVPYWISAGVPALLGEPFDALHCRVWCPWCVRWHTHGLDEDGAFEGYRAAHCEAGSPLKETGYWIVDRRTAERLHRREGVEV